MSCVVAVYAISSAIPRLAFCICGFIISINIIRRWCAIICTTCKTKITIKWCININFENCTTICCCSWCCYFSSRFVNCKCHTVICVCCFVNFKQVFCSFTYTNCIGFKGWRCFALFTNHWLENVSSFSICGYQSVKDGQLCSLRKCKCLHILCIVISNRSCCACCSNIHIMCFCWCTWVTCERICSCSECICACNANKWRTAIRQTWCCYSATCTICGECCVTINFWCISKTILISTYIIITINSKIRSILSIICTNINW